MRRIVEIRKRLTHLNYIQFIGLQTALGLLISIILLIIVSIFNISTPLRHEGHNSTFIEFLLLLMFSAIIETLLFQYLPFIFATHRAKLIPCRKISKPTKYVLFSSILFGIFHIIGSQWMMPFVILKVLFSALCGVVLSVSFYILWRNKQTPVLSVSLIHFLINSILVCFGPLMKKIITIIQG